jgi:hypothetical protein
MILFLIFVAILSFLAIVVCLLLRKFKLSILIFLGLIVIYLASLPCSYYYNKEKIEEFISVREGGNVTNSKRMEYNEWLGSAQYWNNTIFDFYIPDEVMRLYPLEHYYNKSKLRVY